jgi:hypothetical protein
MRLDVKPQTSVFLSGFEPTLHNFYSVPMNGCVDGQVTRRTNAE